MEDVLFHLTKIDIETALAYNVIEVKNGIKRVFKNIQIDSRLIKKNSIFVAIKGDNLDGHSFIKNSVKNGVSAVISEKTLSSSDEKFLVQNKMTLDNVVITDEQVCDGVNVNAGTGAIIIQDGNLTLINGANFSATGLEDQTIREGYLEIVFINNGSRLIST